MCAIAFSFSIANAAAHSSPLMCKLSACSVENFVHGGAEDDQDSLCLNDASANTLLNCGVRQINSCSEIERVALDQLVLAAYFDNSLGRVHFCDVDTSQYS